MIKIGNGYDVHRFVEGKKLILGGVQVPYSMGLDGHSDADVLLHAIMDALLGALALGDIGKHFPPSDRQYRGIDSGTLLAKVVELVEQHNYTIGNIDTVIVAEKPHFAEYIPQMRANIAKLCKTGKENISVKATTEEGLGLAGEGIGTHAIAIIFYKQS